MKMLFDALCCLFKNYILYFLFLFVILFIHKVLSVTLHFIFIFIIKNIADLLAKLTTTVSRKMFTKCLNVKLSRIMSGD